ncbi:hypothetical protein [Microbulbifer sp. RZ01]|uniref:hypothetical protein n=1 Tax=Microbulbifer sp. RZ01 TaxID=3021711 RepID=UPI0027E3FCCC|nr:hypothetical protein [Microbulbifer sp. RZ01]
MLAEFYLRVKPDNDAIGNAAQTLGVRTLDPEALVGSALKHRAMAPLVDSLLKETGVGDFAKVPETEA